jgi:hypothetical protein
VPVPTVADDIAALAAMARDSAGPGERAAAEWVQRRLAEEGVADVALEPYRWPRTHAWAHLPHFALAATGHPLARLAALVSYELDQSGRVQWIERFLPSGDGVNVVARIPARGQARRTFVLVAHVDAQHAGLMWDRRIVEAGAARRLKTRAMAPAGALAGAAIAFGRRLPLGLVAAFVLDTALRSPVPGANDNASGVAALLALAGRLASDPLDETEVLLVFPGAEEAGMGGMRAFLPPMSSTRPGRSCSASTRSARGPQSSPAPRARCWRTPTATPTSTSSTAAPATPASPSRSAGGSPPTPIPSWRCSPACRRRRSCRWASTGCTRTTTAPTTSPSTSTPAASSAAWRSPRGPRACSARAERPLDRAGPALTAP